MALVWCAGILLAPLWADESGLLGNISAFYYGLFSKACHQLDDRSLHMFSHKLGVCSRCTLIYFGFLAAVIVYPFVKKLNQNDMPAMWILLVSAGLVAVDAGLDTFNVVKNTFLTREITGGILGIVLAFFLVPGTIRIFDEFFAPRLISKNQNNASSK